MTEKDFLDQAVLAMLGNSSRVLDPDVLWATARMIWEKRPKNERSKPIRRGAPRSEDYWTEFWNAYDKKVGTAKAKEKFLAIPREDRPAVVAAAKDYAERTPEVKYRKHPLTWLNQQCWLDVAPKDAKTQSEIDWI
ncbi:MAG: hypothetical protein HRT70_05395 [Flavobacteriaceae bacterium]|nr:hypothetical protein [Flavobacteriaceae bacterium]